MVAWLVAVGGLGRWLWGLGGGSLGAPPLDGPGRWGTWAEAVGPVHAVFALLRLGCLAAVAYLLVALLVGLAARLTGVRLLLRASDAISVALVRRLLNGAVGVGVTTGALVAGAGPLVPVVVGAATVDARAGAPPTMRPFAPTGDPDGPPVMGVAESSPPTMRPVEPSPPTMRPVEPEPPTMRPVEPALPTVRVVEPEPPTMRPVESSPPTMRPVEAEPTAAEGDPQPPGTPAPVQPVDLPPPAIEVAGPADPREPSSVVLGPGDHLWAVAEGHLADHLHRSPDDEEITQHWRRLIALNQADLADPANPDLVFSGQRIRLPPL